jgi:hypothetical protein
MFLVIESGFRPRIDARYMNCDPYGTGPFYLYPAVERPLQPSLGPGNEQTTTR